MVQIAKFMLYIFITIFSSCFFKKKSNMLPEKQEGEKVSLRTLDLRCKEWIGVNWVETAFLTKGGMSKRVEGGQSRSRKAASVAAVDIARGTVGHLWWLENLKRVGQWDHRGQIASVTKFFFVHPQVTLQIQVHGGPSLYCLQEASEGVVWGHRLLYIPGWPPYMVSGERQQVPALGLPTKRNNAGLKSWVFWKNKLPGKATLKGFTLTAKSAHCT